MYGLFVHCNKNSGCFREMAVRGSSTVPLSDLCDRLKKILMYSPSLKSTIISLSKKIVFIVNKGLKSLCSLVWDKPFVRYKTIVVHCLYMQLHVQSVWYLFVYQRRFRDPLPHSADLLLGKCSSTACNVKQYVCTNSLS